MKVTIREAAVGDVERVAVLMAPMDVLECKAAGNTPWQGLTRARQQSALCWTGEIDGEPEALFGIVPGVVLAGIGYPWFLGSERARKAQRQFLVEAPRYLHLMETIFPNMEGAVHAHNAAAHRWLIRLGFHVEDWYQREMNGEPMLRFFKGFD